LNKKEKTVAIVAGIIVVALLLVGGFLLFRSLSGHGASADQKRLNTLTLVRTYVEKEEFDRALGLLENLLIDNPGDKDASDLLDIVLAAKKAKQALATGTGDIDASDVEAALRTARDAAARIAAAADAAQKAASRISAVEKNGSGRVAVVNDQALPDVSAADKKQQAKVDAAKAASDAKADEEAAKAEAEKQRKEQAAAEDAKRKALEDELAKKNEKIQQQIADVNRYIEQGKDSASSGNLRSTLASFDKAAEALPDGEKAFAARKYTEMAEALYAIADSATDSTVKNEALASALQYANQAVAADPSLAAAK
jgi:hypothetical protein